MTWKPDFITTKTVDFLHLFQRDLIKRIILDIFDCFRLRKRLKLCCFVIMLNHIHFIGQFAEEDPFADVVRDFRRQTSDRILRQLKVERDDKTLERLAGKVQRREKQQYKYGKMITTPKRSFPPIFSSRRWTISTRIPASLIGS